MKTVLVIALSLCLLFSYTALASAEILFGVSAEAGGAPLSADYSDPTLSDVSKSAGIFIINGNVNLLGTIIRLEYGAADMNPYQFSTTKVKVGWDVGLSVLKAEVYGGYQQLVFTDNTLSAGKQNTYASLIGGVRIESRIDRFTIHGAVSLPLKTYYNGAAEDYNAGLNDLGLGIAYAPMPLVDLFVNYRTMQANSSVVNITTQSYTLGAKFSF